MSYSDTALILMAVVLLASLGCDNRSEPAAQAPAEPSPAAGPAVGVETAADQGPPRRKIVTRGADGGIVFIFPPGERGVYEGSAQDLYGFRKQNAMAFEQQFAGRLIDLSGNVSAVHPDAIVMLNGDAAPWTVKCRFDPNDKDAAAALAKLKVGDPVRILGRYRGKEHWRSPSGFLDLDDCELVSP